MRDAERIARHERLAGERLEFLGRINDAALDTSEPVALMATVTNAAVPRLGDWCTLHYIGEPGTDPLVHAAHVDPDKVAWLAELLARYPFDPDAPTGVAAVIRSGESEFVQIDQEYIEDAIRATTVMSSDDARHIVDALHLTSVITVPLRTPAVSSGRCSS